MHKDIPTSKVFYRPIEAAIRWAGLLRYLPMILAAIASPRFLPPSLNCPRWNECRLYSERIYDGILNGELPYGHNGITLNDPKLLQSPDLTVRHVDLKRWMRTHYPEHRPGFLFSRGERMAHPFITMETGQAILIERLAVAVSSRVQCRCQYFALDTALRAASGAAVQRAGVLPRTRLAFGHRCVRRGAGCRYSRATGPQLPGADAGGKCGRQDKGCGTCRPAKPVCTWEWRGTERLRRRAAWGASPAPMQACPRASHDRTRRSSRRAQVQIERFNEPRLHRQRLLLIGRLQRLQRLGLADEVQPGTWAIHADAEKTLRALGERGDIIRTMQRAMSGQPRELAVFEPGDDGRTIIGRVAAKGLADELHDRGYLVIDGVDGKAHYVALNARDELANYPAGAVVEVKGSADVRAADKNITALASGGLYRTDHHLAIAQGQAVPGRDPQEVVAAHIRRLKALRRAGIVERVAEGLWKVPDDLAERGRQYDAQRLGGVAVELKSHLPIERQARIIGATWLDQQLIGGGKGLGDLGFGSEVKQALQQRADFLAELGLAERRGQQVILARNLPGTLRNREVAQAAKDIAADTGLEHRPTADGQRVSGIYRRSVMLASGRYAMLDDGMGFSLVPWKPVIEHRLGQQLAATGRGGGVSWEVGRRPGLSPS
ncbi:DUF3363 domain-containing protein [Ottowia beijingensis]|uniref:DUF3363 domain-containing protein n=1 Tax=Ottowia beijingensis TaxID=1207057 RepID=UPI00214D418D|nr:DUF3363 domain-containing protein [Ottowia beijingensis]